MKSRRAANTIPIGIFGFSRSRAARTSDDARQIPMSGQAIPRSPGRASAVQPAGASSQRDRQREEIQWQNGLTPANRWHPPESLPVSLEKVFRSRPSIRLTGQAARKNNAIDVEARPCAVRQIVGRRRWSRDGERSIAPNHPVAPAKRTVALGDCGRTAMEPPGRSAIAFRRYFFRPV